LANPDQRRRLIDALVGPFPDARSRPLSIAKTCAAARVSNATFYELFADAEDALVAAYRDRAESFLGHLISAIVGAAPSTQAGMTLQALLQAVAHDPGGAWLLFTQAQGGDRRLLQERARAERRAQELLVRASQAAAGPDVPATALIGALRHIATCHLLKFTEDRLPLRVDDGLAWLYSYARAPGLDRWSTSPRALLHAARPAPTAPRPSPRPQRLPPGRHGLLAGAIARSQRARLINATAEVTMAKGYPNTTVEDIAAAARVAKPVFYRYFKDKQHAFLEAQQCPTELVLARCAQGHFSAREWPERVWCVLEILLETIVSNPALSHLCLVESYAAGPTAIRRTEETTRSFTIFLEEDLPGHGPHPLAAAPVAAGDRRRDLRDRPAPRRIRRVGRDTAAHPSAGLHRDRPVLGSRAGDHPHRGPQGPPTSRIVPLTE
jgi:AcrR family transcriptional regulator